MYRAEEKKKQTDARPGTPTSYYSKCDTTVSVIHVILLAAWINKLLDLVDII